MLPTRAHSVPSTRVTTLASLQPSSLVSGLDLESPVGGSSGVPVGFINARKCQRAASFQSASQEGHWDRLCPWDI